VEDLLSFRARSGVVMAYGSSGAGKTFTIEVRGQRMERRRT
jgi:hypothetical protein